MERLQDGEVTLKFTGIIGASFASSYSSSTFSPLLSPPELPFLLFVSLVFLLLLHSCVEEEEEEAM